MVSIDFWDTLVKAETGGKARRNARLEAICEIADTHVNNLPLEQVEEANRQVSVEFNRVWFNQQRTPTTGELVGDILNHLGIPATKKELEYLVKKFEESIWVGPPQLAEGADEILPALADRYYLSLISDTMYSPGRVIRQFLAGHNLFDCFSGFVFSDEEGYSKPNPKAFKLMLDKTGSKAGDSYHVGDLFKTDIKGAKQVGMNAILYTGHSGTGQTSEEDIRPDYICKSWKEVGELLM